MLEATQEPTFVEAVADEQVPTFDDPVPPIQDEVETAGHSVEDEGDFSVEVVIHRTVADSVTQEPVTDVVQKVFSASEMKRARFKARRFIRDHGLSIKSGEKVVKSPDYLIVTLNQDLTQSVEEDEEDEGVEAVSQPSETSDAPASDEGKDEEDWD